MNFIEFDKLDTSEIKDRFRQHISDRKDNSSCSFLLDHSSLENLKQIKQESQKIIKNYKDLRGEEETSDENSKRFNSFDDFMKCLVDNQEKLHSEKWKLDEVNVYLKHEKKYFLESYKKEDE